MAKINMNELQEIVSRKKIKQVLFNHENQSWFYDSFPMKAELVFSSLLIAKYPDTICLRCNSGTIYFDHIRSVDLEENASALGDVLTITCGCSTTTQRCYTLVLAS